MKRSQFFLLFFQLVLMQKTFAQSNLGLNDNNIFILPSVFVSNPNLPVCGQNTYNGVTGKYKKPANVDAVLSSNCSIIENGDGSGHGQNLHTGDDYYSQDWNWGAGNNDLGIPIYSPYSGKVLYADWSKNLGATTSNSYGKSVLLLLDYETDEYYFILRFSHLNEIKVSVPPNNSSTDWLDISRRVNAGIQLGTIGGSGSNNNLSYYTNAAHLHLTLYKLEKNVNLNSPISNILERGNSPKTNGGVASKYSQEFKMVLEANPVQISNELINFDQTLLAGRVDKPQTLNVIFKQIEGKTLRTDALQNFKVLGYSLDPVTSIGIPRPLGDNYHFIELTLQENIPVYQGDGDYESSIEVNYQDGTVQTLKTLINFNSSGFNDIKSSWYESYAKSSANYGFLKGVLGSFGSNSVITYATAARLAAMAGIKVRLKKNNNTTADLTGAFAQTVNGVSPSHEAYPFFQILKNWGYTLPSNVTVDFPISDLEFINMLIKALGMVNNPTVLKKNDRVSTSSNPSVAFAQNHFVPKKKVVKEKGKEITQLESLASLCTQPIQINCVSSTGRVLNKALCAKLLVNFYEYQYWQNTGSVPTARMAANDSDYSVIGDKFEFSPQITGNPVPKTTPNTVSVVSGQTKTFAFPDVTIGGLPVHVYWSIDGGDISPLGGAPRYQSIVFKAPNVTAPTILNLYYYAATSGGYAEEFYQEIIVNPQTTSPTVPVQLSSSPATLDFGSVSLGSSVNKSIDIFLASGTSYSGSARIVGANSSQFSLNKNTISLPNPNYSTHIVSFQPTSSGTKSASLEIYNSSGTLLSIPISASVGQNDACLSASVNRVEIRSGNTSTLKEQFFTLSNTSQTSTLEVTGIRFEGEDASSFSYNSDLFRIPKSMSPNLSTGFIVKLISNPPTDQVFKADLVITTSNANCPELRLPVRAVHQVSQLSWMSPIQDFTTEAGGGNNIPLQWQGYVEGPDVTIQYSSDNGTTWTNITVANGQTCIGHSNSDLNTLYFGVDQFAGKDLQFRIAPCYDDFVPWQYSGIMHVTTSGQRKLDVTSPNGYEILTSGTTHTITWNNHLNYKTVSLSFSTNGGSSYQPIANVSGEAGRYDWVVPSGINSGFCKVKISAANVSDESDNNFIIQPPTTVPITVSNVSIVAEGCNPNPSGSIALLLSGVAYPYQVNLVEAGVTKTNYTAGTAVTVDQMTAGTYTIIIKDANNIWAKFYYTVPKQNDYGFYIKTEPDTCSGTKGRAVINLVGNFPYPPLYIVTKNSSQIYTGGNGNIVNLSQGTYSVTIKDNYGCQLTDNFIIDNSPGTYFAITPTITNSSCAGVTGAISLNTASAQSPTFTWSNGTMGSSISNLAAGNYSVTVTDNSGCVQSKSFQVLEDSGWETNTISAYTSTGTRPSSEIANNKFYFSHFVDSNTKNRIGILSIPSHTYDYISFSHPNNLTSKAELINFSMDGNFIGAVFKMTYPNSGTNDNIYFVKFDANTKAVLSSVLLIQYKFYSNVNFHNNKLYCVSSTGLDVCDFSANSISNISLSFQPFGIVVDKNNNKAYVCGSGGKIAKVDLTNNTVTEAASSGTGYFISQIGDYLYLARSESGTNNFVLEKILSSNLQPVSSLPIGIASYFSKMAFKSPATLFVPSISPNAIQVVDLNTFSVKSSIPLGFNPSALSYDPNSERVYSASSPVLYLTNNQFDFNSTKTDATCGQNNGTISMTPPDDGKSYTFLWSTGATTQNLSDLGAGTYSVQIKQAGGCAINKSFNITQQNGTTNGGTIFPVSQQICQDPAGQNGNLPQPFSLNGQSGTIVRWEIKSPTGEWANWNQAGQSYSNTCCFETAAGTWKVRAVVRDVASQCPEVYSTEGEVIVRPNPVANFNFTQSGSIVTFSNTSTGGESYSWTFGDGNTADIFSPVKSYTTNGTFSVKLRITNACGIVSEITKTVTINCVPTATLSGTQTINPGEYATLTVKSTGEPSFTIVVNGETHPNISTTYTFTVNPTTTTTYTLTSVSNACGVGTVSGSAVVTVNSTNSTEVYSVKTGSWHDPGTWNCSCVPNNTHTVEIKQNHTVTVSVEDAKMKSVKLSNGILNFQNERKLCFGCN